MNWVKLILEKIVKYIQGLDNAMTEITKSESDKIYEIHEVKRINKSVRQYLSNSDIMKSKNNSGFIKANKIFDKIDSLKSSPFGKCAIAYEDEIIQLVITLSSHREDGEIEIYPENVESLIKAVSSIYDILCHEEKEIEAKKELERLECIKFGELASEKVNRTMDLIKKEKDIRPRVNLDKVEIKNGEEEEWSRFRKSSIVSPEKQIGIGEMKYWDAVGADLDKNYYIKQEFTVSNIPREFYNELEVYNQISKEIDRYGCHPFTFTSGSSGVTYRSDGGAVGMARALEKSLKDSQFKEKNKLVYDYEHTKEVVTDNSWAVEIASQSHNMTQLS